MGVESFLIASSLVAVLSQRLVRKICPACKGNSREQFGDLSQTVNHCKTCGSTGYKGRIGVYELLAVSEKVRQAIIQNKDSVTIAKIATAEGMIPIREDGLKKVKAGMTTEEEVARVCMQNYEE